MHASSAPELAIKAGAPVALPRGHSVWRVMHAPVELYCTLPHGKLFVAEIAQGECIWATDMPDGALSLLAQQDALLQLTNAGTEDFAAWSKAVARADQPLPFIDNDSGAREALSALAERHRDNERARDAALVARMSATPRVQNNRNLTLAIQEAAVALGGTLPTRNGGANDAMDFTSAPRLALRYGLRATPVILPADWAKDDRGPLLVWLEGEAHFLRWERGSYGAQWRGDVAQSLAGSQAFRLHAPLSAALTSLPGMIRSVVSGVRSELLPIAGAAAMAALLGMLLPWLTGWLFDAVVPAGEAGLLIGAGLALTVAAIGTFILGVVRVLAISRVRGRGQTAMMAAVDDHILRLPAGFFRTLPAGDFAQRLSGLEAVRSGVTDVLLQTGLTALFALAYLAQLLSFDTRLALTAIAVTLVVIAITVAARWVQKPALRRAAEASGKLSSLTFELLSGIAKLRTAAAEHRMLDRWLQRYQDERGAAAQGDRIEAHYIATSDIWTIISLAALFATAALVSSAEQEQGLSPGQFIAFLTAFGLLQGAVGHLVEGVMALSSLQPMAERARPILEAATEGGTNLADPGTLTGAISVSALSFAYDGSQRPVIDGLNLSVAPGEHLAIVGGSGSGKSTILRLLLGFEKPMTGAITYDGQDFAGLDPSRVRCQIGVVLQSSQLFAGSILENIRGASDAGLDACLAAAEAAGLATDLRLMPMGLHTPVTEGAGTLSGGQRQRILIARALAGSPRILFLDEATSALDNETQSIVSATMDAMQATRITIAHRLSTVKNADRIAVLQDGRIAEIGDFSTLMAMNGTFAALAHRQLLED